jgi:hypothetical protein
MRTAFAAAIILSALPALATAHADEPQKGTVGAPVTTPTTGETTEFHLERHDLMLEAGFQLTPAGEAVPVQLNAEFSGIHTIDGRHILFRYDASGGATAGYGGNGTPNFIFAGGQLKLDGIAGVRLLPNQHWSPIVAAGTNAQVSAIAVPGYGLGGAPNTGNSLAGLQGVNGIIAGRVLFGASYLNGRNSLLLGVFAQEADRAPASFAQGRAYTEGGVTAEWDLARRAAIILEGTAGETFKTANPIFGTTDQAAHIQGDLGVRYLIGKWAWVGGDLRVSTDIDVTHVNGGPTYTTVTTPAFAAMLGAGVALPGSSK